MGLPGRQAPHRKVHDVDVFCCGCLDYVSITVREYVSADRPVCSQCDSEELFVSLEDFQSALRHPSYQAEKPKL